MTRRPRPNRISSASPSRGEIGLPLPEITEPLVPPLHLAWPAVYLRSPVRQPNVFRKRILKVDPGVKPGDWVIVYAPLPAAEEHEEPNPQILGYGIYNPKAEIALRIVRFGDRPPDQEYWNGLLSRAVQLRRETLRLDEISNAYRVVHAEADGIPGLVIDRFGSVLSLEAYSLGMYLRAPTIAESLHAQLGTTHWVLRAAPQMLAQEGFERPFKQSVGAPRQVQIEEYGTRFRVRLDEPSHKTGFFCDQRENRKRLSEFCSGRTVLDLCCYSGGFAVQAKRLGHAAEVTGVDLDEHPLEQAKANANLNQVRIRFVQADVFPYMREMIRTSKQFDVVVLDPPKLIRSRAELEEGTQKHFDLNRLAIQLVRPGGILLTCTCAGLLPGHEFRQLVARAAGHAAPPRDNSSPEFRHGRNLQIFAQSGAAADHPVASNCLASEYLHAIWARVGDPV